MPVHARAAPGPFDPRVVHPGRVDLGNLAQHDPLALEIKHRVLGHPGGSLPERAFSNMWGTIVVVRRAVPQALGASLRELTLRFDYGRLIIHDGRVGRPDITLWGADGQVLALGEVASRPTAEPVFPWRTPGQWWAMGRTISRISSAPADGEHVEVFGMLAHPRLLYRLALVLSLPVGPAGGETDRGETQRGETQRGAS